ncbi:acetylglutamate kinase [Pseudidiomarina sp.]|uniref:acetylglutamate kinase n=1 Tax=Pseudidiomarina sp. TaxID=2081707 RepID=UPI003A97414A
MNTLVLKLGGRVLQNAKNLSALLSTVQQLAQLRPLVLVHGGGDQVEQMLLQLGHTSLKVDGQRITPTAQMPIVAGVLAGDINSQLVALAQQHQLNAVGLTLADGQSVRCDIDSSRGAVGVPFPNNAALLTLLLAHNYVPILSSIGVSADGQRLNVNADLAAAAITQLLDADLVLLTDVPGILDKHGALIDSISIDHAEALIADGTVRDGMLVKLNAAVQAAQASRRSIAVAGWQNAKALTRLAQGKAAGTRIHL